MLINDVWVSPDMVPQLCQLTGKHRTTVMRWLRRGELPKPVRDLLRILNHGDLGAIHSAWRGWRITKTGELYAPNDQQRGFTPGCVSAIPWRLHQVAALQRDVSAPASSCESPQSQCRVAARSS